jgi:hypothetical protein
MLSVHAISPGIAGVLSLQADRIPSRVDTLCQSPKLQAVALTHFSMPNTPAYILYHGRNTGKDKDGKKIWTRIGAVWPNKSGKGFNRLFGNSRDS